MIIKFTNVECIVSFAHQELVNMHEMYGIQLEDLVEYIYSLLVLHVYAYLLGKQRSLMYVLSAQLHG